MSEKIKNIYFFLVVLYSGLALAFFRSHEGLISLWILGLFIFRKESLQLNKNLIIALSVWLGYFFINMLIIRSFHPMFMGIYIAKLMIAYWFLTYYRERIFEKYENLIYKLTILSLVFYISQLLIPSVMWNIFQGIDLSENLFPQKYYASIGIYTFHQFELGELYPRNSGFTWEPGPFSAYIMLAVYINLARNGVKINDKKRLLIFLIGLITTQSSTGMLVLMAVIIWYAWSSNKSKTLRLLSMPIAIALVIFLFSSVPWLQEKIISESQQDVEELLIHASISGESYNPGRFASFQLRWQDFINYPIAGVGGKTSLETGYLGEGNVVSAVNGVGTILGKYGTIGFLLFVGLIYNTGKWLARYYKYSAHLIYPVSILIIGFGFGIIESPIIATTWLIPVFLPIKNENIKIRKT
jgi:hypothetical protein